MTWVLITSYISGPNVTSGSNPGHTHTLAAITNSGTLASLNSVNAATITDNSVGADELNVSGYGTSSQFLRSDGDGTMTWATPSTGSNTATAVDNILDGSNSGTAITYKPYTAAGGGHFDTSTANPTATNRLNFGGKLHATKVTAPTVKSGTEAEGCDMTYNSTSKTLDFIFS